jgi:hypothetical protein
LSVRVGEVLGQHSGYVHAFSDLVLFALRPQASAMREIVGVRFAIAGKGLVGCQLVQLRRVVEQGPRGLGRLRPGRCTHRRTVVSILLAMNQIMAGHRLEVHFRRDGSTFVPQSVMSGAGSVST